MIRGMGIKASLCAALVASLALAGCARWRVIDRPSPNHDGRVRFLVMHFTDEDFARSLHTLTNPDSKRRVSSHYLVSAPGDPARAPRVYRLVPETLRAWHAGDSRWQGRQAVNDQSIGIEIVYEPKCIEPHALPPVVEGVAPLRDPCVYPEFPPAQIARVAKLARGILVRYPDIDPTRVVGHADVAPNRKNDPGPRFPWRELAVQGIGAWFDDREVARFRDAIERAHPPLDSLARDALEAYGYGIADAPDPQTRLREALFAFQTHFRAGERTGTADAETVAIALALLAKYRVETLPPIAAKFGLAIGLD